MLLLLGMGLWLWLRAQQEDHRLETTQVSVHWTEEERAGPHGATTTHRKSLSAAVNLKGPVTLDRLLSGGWVCVWVSLGVCGG